MTKKISKSAAPKKVFAKAKAVKNTLKKVEKKTEIKGERGTLNIDNKKRYSSQTPPKSKVRTPKSEENKDSISINKYISDTGYCSRREADHLIEQGRVSINGEAALKGNRVTKKDDIEVDGDTLSKLVKNKK